VRGLADGCQQLGIPVTGGNVSLYNQTGTTAILPTPVVAVLGVIDDVRRRTSVGWSDGQELLLLGTTREELSGSEWAHVVHGHLGGRPPRVDLAADRSLARLLADLVGVATSAHDLSDGGLAQALTEACLVGGIGATVDPGAVADDAFVALFSESAARVIVTVPAEHLEELRARCDRHGVPVADIGTTGGDALVVEGAFDVPLADLRTAWSATLPAALGV
jgi:phosphoribosylformylglycinamidine synthase subunit PurL